MIKEYILFQCECCCEDNNHFGECGQRKLDKGCEKYGTTNKYTVGTTPTCQTDNPTNPDIAVIFFDLNLN